MTRQAVSLEELCALFTGVPAEDNGWSTSPCYTVPLAFEIARRCGAQSEYVLRTLLYDKTAADDVPPLALAVIKVAAERFREHKRTNEGNRGL